MYQSIKLFFCQPEQVAYPVRQVTFHSHLPDGQGPRQDVCQLNQEKQTKACLARQAKFESCLTKGKLEFKVCSSRDKIQRAGNIAKWLT